MKAIMSYFKRFIACGMVLCLFLLSACGGPANAVPANATATQAELSTNPTKTATVPSTPTTSTHPAHTPVVATPVLTPGSGPTVILTPTPVPGGGSSSQLVTLADRTLTINSVSQQPGNSVNSTAVTLVMSVKNTGAQAIQNAASFYELAGSEGDIFGVQSSATPSFFGTIPTQGALSGTIVFQVPTAAAKGLRLLFRPEVVSETVFVKL